MTKWKQGEIIRHRHTGDAYLVLFTHYKIGSIICDMTDTTPIPMVLFERDYDDFARDCDMKCTNNQWEYDNPHIFI